MTGIRARTVATAEGSVSLLEAGAPEHPTVVLVHGYPDSKELWRGVIARLHDHFHVVAYDVRGSGGSTAPCGPAGYSFRHLADDLAAVLDAVSPGRAVHLVGHDWGGIAGWEFAAMPRFDGRLASFTTIAGPALGHARLALRGDLRRGRLARAAGNLLRSWYIIALSAPGLPTLLWRGRFAREGWTRYLRDVEGIAAHALTPVATRAQDGIHGANLYRRNILLGGIARPPRARVPVQQIVPDGDRFVPPAYHDAAAGMAPGLRRRTVPGSHWAPLQAPERVAGLIADFVYDLA
jgi:pimeloyl-ACP methyl ester carboxylesterase